MIHRAVQWMEKTDSRRKLCRILFAALLLYGAVGLLGGLWVNLIYLGVRMWDHVSPQTMAVSIGIIGGADGPTAVFVTAPPWVHYLLPAACVAVGSWGIRKLRKRE